MILEVDTPGGLDTSMRDIIRAILASPVPVVTYVSPSGARAASAGTYILYASHIAAMAPATNLGAATPVSIGGESPPEPNPTSAPSPTSDPNPTPAPNPTSPRSPRQPPSRHRTARPGKDLIAAPNDTPPAAAPQPATAMERKVINDAVAYIRGLAELRGRNADWAEHAVRGAASLSATAALQQKVIDVVARDIPDLLTQIDGREVKIGDHPMKLATRDLAIQRVKPDWRTELLAVITIPRLRMG